MAAPPLMNNRAIHSARLLVSPVWGSLESSFSFAVTVSAFSNASCSAYFVAGVLGIPLVHYVEERGEVVIPVSYTHLDVYKRQGKESVLKRYALQN